MLGGCSQTVIAGASPPAASAWPQHAAQHPTTTAVAGLKSPAPPCGPFNIGPLIIQLQPAAVSAEDTIRCQKLMDALLARANAYGMALLGQEDKLSCLARLTDADLVTILAEPSPELLLDRLWSVYQHQLQQQLEQHIEWQDQQRQHQQQHQEADIYYPPPPAQPVEHHEACEQHQQRLQDQQHQPQQPHEQQQQQQQDQQLMRGKILGPRDLVPQAAGLFESSLPAGLLPAKWWHFARWGDFEINCKFTVAGADAASVQKLRLSFKQAKDKAIAATLAAWQQQAFSNGWHEQQSWQASSNRDNSASSSSSSSESALPATVSLTAATAAAVAGGPCADLKKQNDAQANGTAASASGASTGSSWGGRQSTAVGVSAFIATQVKLDSKRCSTDEASARRRRLLDAVSAAAPEYAAALEQQPSKLALLARITAADLGIIMQQPAPTQVLDSVHRHLCATQRIAAIKPCHLSDEQAAEFAAALPPKALPASWRSYRTWRMLSADINIRAFPRTATFAEVRSLLREQAAHVQEAASQQQRSPKQQHSAAMDMPEQEQEQQRQQQISPTGSSNSRIAAAQQPPTSAAPPQEQSSYHSGPRPSHLPPDIASEFAAAIPEGVLPADWQTYNSWRSLEDHLGFNDPGELWRQKPRHVNHEMEHIRAVFRTAKRSAGFAYDAWAQQKREQQHAASSSSSNGTAVGHQQAGKRAVAPRDLCDAAASLFASQVPAGMLPVDWREYPTWADLDVGLCYTAAHTDKAAIEDMRKRYKEAKQAALAAELEGRSAGAANQPSSQKAAVVPAGSHYRSSAGLQQGGQHNSSSSGAASGLPAAATTLAASTPSPAAAARTPVMANGTGTAAAAGLWPLSRSGSDMSSSSTMHGRSSTSNMGNGPSRLGSSNLPHPALVRHYSAGAQPPVAPPRSKYIPAGDPFCYRCGFRGHLGEDCSTPYCPSCTQWGHADGIDCLSACHYCGRLHKGANSSRCWEAECRECGLMGHKLYECPYIICSFCNCSGHNSQNCEACGECRQWGHSADKCPGYCNKCHAVGHKAADCSSKRCAQCGKAGCVVGMCTGAAGDSSSRRSNKSSKSSSRAAAGSTVGASSSSAAAAQPFDVSNVTFDLADDEQAVEERRHRLMNRLMNVPELEEYACTLLTDTEKLAVLATISAADLSLIMQLKNPGDILDQIHSMQATGSNSSSTAQSSQGPTQAAQQQQQQKGPSGPELSQQQERGVVMPCDLWPQHRHMFEGRLPEGSLPEHWYQYSSWHELEKRHVELLKNGSNGVIISFSNTRLQFRRERQRVQAAAAADMAAGLQPQQQEPVQQALQQQQQERVQQSPHRQQDHGQQQQQVGSRGWEKAAISRTGSQQQEQQQQQSGSKGTPPTSDYQQPQSGQSDGWPALEPQHQNGPSTTADTWAEPAATLRQLLVTENAWEQPLPHTQPQQQQQGAQEEFDASAEVAAWPTAAEAAGTPALAQQQRAATQQGEQQSASMALSEQQQSHLQRAGSAGPAAGAWPPPQQLQQSQLAQAYQQEGMHQPGMPASLPQNAQHSAAAAAAGVGPNAAVPAVVQLQASSAAAPGMPSPVQQVPGLVPGNIHLQQPPLLPHLLPQQQQQQQPQQQQPPQAPAAPAKVLGPRDLDPEAAHRFQSSLPAGMLPEKWQDWARWGAFELQCNFTVMGTQPETVQELRQRFKQAREKAIADTQAARGVVMQQQQQQQMVQQQQLVHQQQQQHHSQGLTSPVAGMPAAATAAVGGAVAPSPSYVVGHSPAAALPPQQPQQQFAGPVAAGLPAAISASMYAPAVPAAAAVSPGMVHPASHMMMTPALLQQQQQQMLAYSQYPPAPVAIGIPVASAMAGPAMAVLPAAAAAAPAAAPAAVGQVLATAASAGVDSDDDDDLSSMMGLCGVQTVHS